MNRPQADEFAEYYQKYIDSVSDDVLAELESQGSSFPDFLRAHTDRAEFAYASGKWTLKELLGHVIDTERIMAYRLLRISRKDVTPLAGFDESDFVNNSNFKNQDIEELIREFEAVRSSNLYLCKSLTDEQLLNRGTASGFAVSVRALLFIMVGHVKHHERIIRERYL